MDVDVLIPCAEPRFGAAQLARCVGTAPLHHVFVLANGALDAASLAQLRRSGATVRRDDAPRGVRLREAARQSRAEALCFLHADTKLPPGSCDEIARRLQGQRVWGAFRLALEDDAGRTRLRAVAFGANLRSRWLSLPYGDQAPFVRRTSYEAVDGHPPWTFLDDLELSVRLRRLTRPALSSLEVRSSARRYLEHGAFRTVCRHFAILVRRALGQSPESLSEMFRR